MASTEGPGGTPRYGDSGDRAARLFVGAIGVGLTIVLLAYVAAYGSDVPVGDGFEVVPVLTGARPASASWLWESSQGHRVYLRKFLLLLLEGVTGHPFRVAAFLSVLLLSLSSLFCVAAARRMRGRTLYLDAVFPLLLLDPGWGRSLLDATILTGFLRTALLTGILFLASGIRPESPYKSLRNISLCALGLAACLTTGLIAALPIAAWAALRTRSPRGDPAPSDLRSVLVIRGSALAALLYLVLYLPGLSLSGIPFGDQGAGRVLEVSLQTLGQGFGPAGGLGWRENRLALLESAAPPLLSVAALALVLVPVALLVLRREAGDRLRIEGFAAVGLAALLVAVSTGLGRGALEGESGLRIHYGLTALPGLAAGLLLLPVLLEGDRSTFMLHGFFALSCALLTFNVQVGCRSGRDLRERMRVLKADVRAGLDLRALATRHSGTLQAPPGELEGLLGEMRRSRRAPFD